MSPWNRPGQTHPPSLRTNVRWAGAANVARGLCQWAMIATLAKMGTPVVVGQYVLGLAVTAPLMLLAGLQLNAVQVSDSREEFSLADYLGLRCLMSALACVALLFIVSVGDFGIETALVILTVGAAKALDAVSDGIVSSWQQREQMAFASSISITNAICSFVFLAVAIAATGSVVAAAAASASASGLTLILALMLAARFGRAGGGFPLPRWDGTRLKKLILLALPLGGVGALLSLNVNVPRYYVQHYLGDAALGVFAAAAYPMVAGDVFIGALTQSACPRFARLFASDGPTALKRLLWQLSAVGAAAGVLAVGIAVSVGGRLLAVLYRPEYAAQAGVFSLIVLSVAVRYCYVFIGVAATAMRLFAIQLWLRLAFFAFLCAVTPAFIFRFGLTGAAAALVLVNVLEGLAWVRIGYVHIWRDPALQLQVPGHVQPTGV